VIQICRELGITIKERSIQRAALYVADEVFFSGTAAEITPVRSVDRIAIGNGGRGELTEKIQKFSLRLLPASARLRTVVDLCARAGRPRCRSRDGERD